VQKAAPGYAVPDADSCPDRPNPIAAGGFTALKILD
jgi:hypothetical protein